MDDRDKSIFWGKNLLKYDVPTILKESLLKPYFQNIQIKEPILDLGCGTGYFSEIFLNRGLKVLGIDKNGSIKNTELFTFQNVDIVDFKSAENYKTVFLINILSVETTKNRGEIIKKLSQILDFDGTGYILTTSSKLYTSQPKTDLISFKKINNNKIKLKVKLVNNKYIEFEDYIVPEEETRKQILENNLKILEEKEFVHTEMDRPVYVLYIVKRK